MATPLTLGAGVNEAVVYERGGTRRLFTIPAVSGIEWGRSMDAVSRATVQVSREALSGGETWKECGDLLGSVHPWAHELVIYRSGERVWEGPVRRPSQTRSGVTIAASDVLGWTERRVIAAARAGTVSVRDEVVAALTAAYTGDDPDVLAHLTTAGTNALTTTLDVKAASGYYSQHLATLVTAGLSYTVVGRRIVVWTDGDLALGVTPILNPTRHLVGDVEVAREGDVLATDAWLANDDGEAGHDGGTDTFYGLVQRLTSGAGIVGAAALAAAAGPWRATRYPAPQSLDVPDGATLNCDAPFPISILVPGVRTQVEVTDLCWPVSQTMVLTGIKVAQGSDSETVGVTYAPLSSDEG